MTLVSDDAMPRAPFPEEVSIHASMAEIGTKCGEEYEKIWDSVDHLVSTLMPRLASPAETLVNSVKRRWPVNHVVSIILFVTGTITFSSISGSSSSDLLSTLWIIITVAWFFSLYTHVKKAHDQEQVALERAAWLQQVGLYAAWDVIYERQVAARSHAPINDPALPFSPKGAMPLPQQFGVSHQGAEALCAEWMRFYGEEDAEITQFTADGGIDIKSLHYIAQVKNYAGTVGVAEVREMAGTALDDGRKALFFTSGSYAAGAITFADRVGIPLFIYDAIQGTLTGANGHAESIFATGL